MKYLHHETGTIKKEWGGKLPVLLVYPDTYRAGMSNLAVHTVYKTLNELDNVVCERCFWRKGEKDPVSIESKRGVNDFSVIALSVSFETDYINVVDFIKSSHLELYAYKRTYGPLIIAGGIAVTLNPEPIAEFMDLCVIGEAEGVVEDIMDIIQKGINSGKDKTSILHELDELEGVYVPLFYNIKYGSNSQIEEIEHAFKKGKKVKRHIAPELNRASSTTIYTNNTTFSGMHLQEVSRGCNYRCRFCISGYAYLPPRHRHIEWLKRDLNVLPETVKRVGIVSPMVTDYPYLKELLDYIHSLGLKASMSSMHVNALMKFDLNKLDISTDQFSAAIAPEAGTYRLRRILNKDLRDEHIFSAVRFLIKHKIKTLKLYFLIGIPTETDEDIKAIGKLILEIKGIIKSEHGRIQVSINPLIPKPFTPLQWIGLITPQEVKNRLRLIREMLRSSDVLIEWERYYLLQGILSRGDRRLSKFLVYLSEANRAINQAIKTSGIDIDYYAFRSRTKDEILPWDFIDYGFKKDFLFTEYKLGMKGIFTPPCNPASCNICGICHTFHTPEMSSSNRIND